MNLKKALKVLIIVIVYIIAINNIIFSYNLSGEDIWMGWSNNQYNQMSYGAVADYSLNDDKLNILGYGRYQFYYKTNLVDFLSSLDSNYFNKYIQYGKGSDKLNKFENGLQIAFTDYFNDNKDKMISGQDDYIYNNYYLPLKNKLNDRGVLLTSEYIKGAVMSYAMFNIGFNEISQSLSGNIVDKIASFYDEDENKFITNIYDFLIESNESNENLKERFSKEKRACLEHQNDELNSKIGEMLNTEGVSYSLSSIRDLNNQKPSIFKSFLTEGKFYTKNQDEWYQAVRTSANYSKEFGIDSGVMDFGIATSRGYNVDNYIDLVENEVAFKKPNDEFDIIYIPQNYSGNDKKYAEVKFGKNNIGQGGGSLACISMCINKLLNYSGDSMVLPNNLVDKIKEKHNNNYNYYYDEEKKGQKNEIINDLCSYYGLNSNHISGDTLSSSVANGNLVIARVQECEFSKYGNFILIVGSKNIDGNQMYVVYDPNMFHANTLYKLYDKNYLINDCKGIFFEVG